MSEDDYLLSEILFNPNTPEQLRRISDALEHLREMIESHDSAAMKKFLDGVRDNIR